MEIKYKHSDTANGLEITEYPCIGICEYAEDEVTLVMFLAPNVGYCINDTSLCHPIGYLKNDWTMINFEKFEGEIHL